MSPRDSWHSSIGFPFMKRSSSLYIVGLIAQLHTLIQIDNKINTHYFYFCSLLSCVLCSCGADSLSFYLRRKQCFADISIRHFSSSASYPNHTSSGLYWTLAWWAGCCHLFFFRAFPTPHIRVRVCLASSIRPWTGLNCVDSTIVILVQVRFVCDSCITTNIEKNLHKTSVSVRFPIPTILNFRPSLCSS